LKLATTGVLPRSLAREEEEWVGYDSGLERSSARHMAREWMGEEGRESH
jgi:hypothetical protein